MEVKEYELNTDKTNLAKVALQNRYPEKGYVVNTESEMVIYVYSGDVTLIKDGQQIELSKDSVVLIEKNQSYAWEPKPEVTLLIFSTPPWSKEQQVIL